jgi:hypothetical protein
MTVLALLLLFDAALHALVIFRFGLGDKNNTPFLVYAILDLVLAVAVFFAWPYALWATLILSAIGILGLTATFSKPQREKTVDKIIWLIDALVVIGAIYLLFFAASP